MWKRNIIPSLSKCIDPSRFSVIIRKQFLACVRSNFNKFGDVSSQIAISCKNKSKNHYVNQNYQNWSPSLLVASSWKNERKSSGDYFTINPTVNEPLVFKSHKIDEVNLHCSLRSSLSNLKVTHISSVQKSLLTQKLDRHLLCSTEAGVGKSFASILFILHHIYASNLKGYCAFIVCRSRLLVTQITETFLNLNLNSVFLVNCEIDFTPIDVTKAYVCISSMEWLKSTNVETLSKYHGVKFVVFDEADTCLSFDTENFSHVRKFFYTISDHDNYPHVQLLSNSVPENLPLFFENIASACFDYVSGKYLHCLLPQLSHTFKRVTRSSKGASFMYDLRALPSRKKILVLCRFSSFKIVKLLLNEKGMSFSTISHQSDLPRLSEVLKLFRDGKIDILVSTHNLTGGYDFSFVDMIMNFDFPNSLSLYLNIAGLYGREKGFLYNYVTEKDEIDLVMIIESCVRRVSEKNVL